MPEALRYAGIDVSQDWLDVAIHGLGQPWRLTPRFTTTQGRCVAHRSLSTWSRWLQDTL